jgi:hypothetical protein
VPTHAVLPVAVSIEEHGVVDKTSGLLQPTLKLGELRSPRLRLVGRATVRIGGGRVAVPSREPGAIQFSPEQLDRVLLPADSPQEHQK